MRSFLVFIGLVAFIPALSFGANHREGESWVTEHLRGGGTLESITGLVVPADWREQAPFDDLNPRGDLPKSFDWRKEAGGLQPVRNQKSCGSCWAFSVVATLEALIKIHQKKTVDLAEQTLVSTCSSSGSCSGGYFSAFNYLRTPGLPDEAQDPYRAVNTYCKSGLVAKERITSWQYVGSRDREASIQQLKTAIMEKGPLSVGVYVNSNFTRYKEGIFDACASGTINHMVNLEGWDDDGRYWILRNSWGDTWGEGGYMRIAWTALSGRKCNNVGEIAAYAVLP